MNNRYNNIINNFVKSFHLQLEYNSQSISCQIVKLAVHLMSACEEKYFKLISKNFALSRK